MAGRRRFGGAPVSSSPADGGTRLAEAEQMRLCSAAFLLFLLSVAMPWEPAAATPAEALIVRVDPQMAGRAAANPFLVPSLERALDLVAQLRRREPGAAIVVELAPGVHRLTRPLR